MESYLYILRKSLGLSQRQMAEQTGVDQATISRWERPGAKIPPAKVELICGRLNVPAHLLLRGQPTRMATVGDWYYWLTQSIKVGAIQVTGERLGGRLQKGTLLLFGVPYPDPYGTDDFLDWETEWRHGAYRAPYDEMKLCLIDELMY